MIKRLQHVWPPGIRAQLTLWYTIVFAMLILLFGIVFYTTLQASLASSVDTTLQLRTQQIAEGIRFKDGKVTIQDVTGELPDSDAPTMPVDSYDSSTTPEAPGSTTTTNNPDAQTNQAGKPSNVTLGTLVCVLYPTGGIAYISPAFRNLAVPADSITQPLQGTPWRGTVTASHGQAVRLYSTALIDKGQVFAIVQVGQSLAQLNATLQSISLGLLVLAPFVLILSAFGSYWLAGRAFRPIHRLAHTAQEIGASDLHQRVLVPPAKDEVQDLALIFNEMIERLERAFAQQRRFVADASHELRTPVAVIRSITDVALSQPSDLEEYDAVLREVNAESERLGQLINDLLVLARADEGQAQLDHDEVRLDLLTADTVDSLEPLATERGITLQIQQLSPATVKGDAARLIQVIMSLVDNALTYTNSGGTVTLSVQVVKCSARLIVRDTGIGIAPEDVKHIFERFYRADRARSRAAGGSGLGLAIVDWVVRAHGGSVAVESQPGQGSTFTVTLPLAADTEGMEPCETNETPDRVSPGRAR